MPFQKEGLWISALTNQIKQVNRVLNITGHFQDRGVGLDYLGDKLFDLEFFFKDLRVKKAMKSHGVRA